MAVRAGVSAADSLNARMWAGLAVLPSSGEQLETSLLIGSAVSIPSTTASLFLVPINFAPADLRIGPIPDRLSEDDRCACSPAAPPEGERQFRPLLTPQGHHAPTIEESFRI
ncbi:MAG: hypothetical protein C4321_04670 [Chloroflexota bacterium]